MRPPGPGPGPGPTRVRVYGTAGLPNYRTTARPSTGQSQPFSCAIRTASARLRAASFWIAVER